MHLREKILCVLHPQCLYFLDRDVMQELFDQEDDYYNVVLQIMQILIIADQYPKKMEILI